jgi:Fanconi anemia group M protein
MEPVTQAKETKALIVVDNRESPEFDLFFSKSGAAVERKQLEVGDFICSERLVVERKTRADFESSIIDGRLFSQLHNLVSSYPRVAIVVEGEVTEGRVSKEALLGAYAAIVSDFGASVFFTRNLEKTAELIYALAKHDQLAKKQTMRVFAKRKTLTASSNQRAIVEMLPMVGPKLAKSLLLHFDNVETLFTASEEELKKVEGMGQKRAKTIRSIIENSYDEEEDKAVMI